jgi:hypothetical protein
MSPEEFFMYLTIALIVAVPVAVRLYRRATLSRTTELLRHELHPPAGTPPDKPGQRSS